MYKKIIIAFIVLFSIQIFATTCPDPITSPLSRGEVPAPWKLSPISPNRPKDNGNFYQANILVIGYGRGVVCTYQIENGFYSILWEVIAKIPPWQDNNWRDTLGGYLCTTSLTACMFYP